MPGPGPCGPPCPSYSPLSPQPCNPGVCLHTRPTTTRWGISVSLSLHSRYPTPNSESSSPFPLPLPQPPTPSHTLRHLLELAVLLGQPTFSLTPPCPFWRSLRTSMALVPHLFSASITFGGKSPFFFFGLFALIISALEHLASPGAVPLGPAVPPPWRSILHVC